MKKIDDIEYFSIVEISEKFLKNKKEKEIYIISLKIKLNEKIINTGYGIKWEKEQDANYFLKLAKDIGFEVIEEKIAENIFFIKFRKS